MIILTDIDATAGYARGDLAAADGDTLTRRLLLAVGYSDALEDVVSLCVQRDLLEEIVIERMSLR